MATDHEAFWSARYRDIGEAFLFGTAPNAFLAAQAADFTPGQRVLSLADGEGRNAVWLAGRGCLVSATEISPVALDKARRFAAAQGQTVDFQAADILAWDWPTAAYDAVVGIFIQFAEAGEQARLFAGMQQALKPGGRIYLHGYTPQQLEYRTGGPSAVGNLYTRDLLAAAFADWEILRLAEYEAELNEGSAHVGRSALIDLIAKKPA